MLHMKILHIFPSVTIFYPDLTYALPDAAREIDYLTVAELCLINGQREYIVLPVEDISSSREALRVIVDANFMGLSPVRMQSEKQFVGAPLRYLITGNKGNVLGDVDPYVDFYRVHWKLLYEPYNTAFYALLLLNYNIAGKIISEISKSLDSLKKYVKFNISSCMYKISERLQRKCSYYYISDLSALFKDKRDDNIFKKSIRKNNLSKKFNYYPNTSLDKIIQWRLCNKSLTIIFLPQLSRGIIESKSKPEEYSKFMNSLIDYFIKNNVHVKKIFLSYIYNVEQDSFKKFLVKIMRNYDRKQGQIQVEVKRFSEGHVLDECKDEYCLIVFYNDFNKKLYLKLLKEIHSKGDSIAEKIIVAIFNERAFVVSDKANKDERLVNIKSFGEKSGLTIEELHDKDYILLYGHELNDAIKIFSQEDYIKVIM